MAAQHRTRGAGADQRAAGPHPAALPVQQHEHDRSTHALRSAPRPKRPSRTCPTCCAPIARAASKDLHDAESRSSRLRPSISASRNMRLGDRLDSPVEHRLILPMRARIPEPDAAAACSRMRSITASSGFPRAAARCRSAGSRDGDQLVIAVSKSGRRSTAQPTRCRRQQDGPGRHVRQRFELAYGNRRAAVDRRRRSRDRFTVTLAGSRQDEWQSLDASFSSSMTKPARDGLRLEQILDELRRLRNCAGLAANGDDRR